MPSGIFEVFLTQFPVTGSKDEDFCQSCRMSRKQNGRLAEKSNFSYTSI